MAGRTRRFIGTIVLIVFIFVYFIVVMAIAASILPNAGTTLEVLYWAVTGMAWAIPVALLIKWMYRAG